MKKKITYSQDQGIFIKVLNADNLIQARLVNLNDKKDLWEKCYSLGTNIKVVCDDLFKQNKLPDELSLPVVISQEDFHNIQKHWLIKTVVGKN